MVNYFGFAWSISVDYTLTGFTRNFGAQGNDFFIAFTNDSLEVINHSVIVEANDQEGWDIDYLGDNAFILTGKGIGPGNNDNDMKLIKLDYYALNSTEENIEDWQITPNPAASELKITNVKLDSKISIYNSLGQLMSTFKLNSPIIDVSELTDGIYYICVDFKNRINAKKLIIAR